MSTPQMVECKACDGSKVGVCSECNDGGVNSIGGSCMACIGSPPDCDTCGGTGEVERGYDCPMHGEMPDGEGECLKC